MVATSAEKIGRLAGELNGDAAGVRFVDMAGLGQNPACIIPAWRDFVDERRPARGIGEPIWAGRSEQELVECHHHESLLNLAFADGANLRLVCPYDTAGLDSETIAASRKTHPYLSEGGSSAPSKDYLAPDQAPSPFEGELPEPAGDAALLEFDGSDVREARNFVWRWAEAVRLDPPRSQDLMLAAHELASNSIKHGGGRGTLLVWQQDGEVLCEVRDSGRIDGPLVGRELPPRTEIGGRGLWIVNHLCDLVQIRSVPGRNVVRVHLSS